MEKCMKALVNKNIKFKLSLSDDGSGKGAALIAIVVDHYMKKFSKSTSNGDDNEQEGTRIQFLS
jgi:hypothetical protein